jgi:hypothetical protein
MTWQTVQDTDGGDMAIDTDGLLDEHLAGASTRQLAARHGISKSRISLMLGAAVDNLALEVVVSLYSAHRDGEDAVWAFGVPYQDQPDRQAALRVFEGVVKRLKDRNVPIRVETRSIAPGTVDVAGMPSAGGQVFAIALDQDELDRRAAAKEE